MMDTNLKTKIIETLDRSLGSRVSVPLKESLTEIIGAPMNNGQDLENALNKVRLTIKLFISEELSEQVHRELRILTGLKK